MLEEEKVYESRHVSNSVARNAQAGDILALWNGRGGELLVKITDVSFYGSFDAAYEDLGTLLIPRHLHTRFCRDGESIQHMFERLFHKGSVLSTGPFSVVVLETEIVSADHCLLMRHVWEDEWEPEYPDEFPDEPSHTQVIHDFVSGSGSSATQPLTVGEATGTWPGTECVQPVDDQSGSTCL